MAHDLDDGEPVAGSNIAETLANEFRQLGRTEAHILAPSETDDALALLVTAEGRQLHDFTTQVEQLRDQPRALRQQVVLGDEASFLRYLAEYKLEAPARSVVFVRTNALEAVLDYHGGPAQPAWCRHVATLPLPYSPEWERWASPRSLTQREFSEFIEAYVEDLTSIPAGSSLDQLAKTLELKTGTPADVVKASRGLSLTVEAQVNDAVNLGDGSVQVSFTEATKGAQAVTVPGLIAVSVPVFERGEHYLLGVRVRFAVKREGDRARVQWTLQPYQPTRIRDTAHADLAGRIIEATGLPVFIGHRENGQPVASAPLTYCGPVRERR